MTCPMAIFRCTLMSAWLICLTSCGVAPSTDEKADAGATVQRYALTIRFGKLDRPDITWQWETGQQATALGLLQAAAQQCDFPLHYRGRGATAFVESIAGVRGGDGPDWWMFRVNDQLSQQGADVMALSPGDHVEWRLGNYDVNNSSDE